MGRANSTTFFFVYSLVIRMRPRRIVTRYTLPRFPLRTLQAPLCPSVPRKYDVHQGKFQKKDKG